MRVGTRTVTVQFVEQRVQQKNLFSLLRDDASSLLLDVVEVPMSIFFPPVCCDSFLTTMMMIRTRRSDVRDDDIRGVRKRRATCATTNERHRRRLLLLWQKWICTQRGRRGIMHTITPRVSAWGHFGTQMMRPFFVKKKQQKLFSSLCNNKYCNTNAQMGHEHR